MLSRFGVHYIFHSCDGFLFIFLTTLLPKQNQQSVSTTPMIIMNNTKAHQSERIGYMDLALKSYYVTVQFLHKSYMFTIHMEKWPIHRRSSCYYFSN